MNSRTEFYRTHFTDNKRLSSNMNLKSNPYSHSENNEIIDLLITEGGESLYNYVEWLGLINDPNLIVLSSQRHYFYGEEDLMNVTAVINLKQLNQIKNLSVLLQSVFKVLKPKSHFIGCFAESYKHLEFQISNNSRSFGNNRHYDALEDGIVSRNPLINRIYNFIDSKTNRYMTRKDVYSLFESHGFKIIDMSELEGLTYFHSQKVNAFTD